MNRRDLLCNGLWALGGIAVAGPDVLDRLNWQQKYWAGWSFTDPKIEATIIRQLKYQGLKAIERLRREHIQILRHVYGLDSAEIRPFTLADINIRHIPTGRIVG